MKVLVTNDFLICRKESFSTFSWFYFLWKLLPALDVDVYLSPKEWSEEIVNTFTKAPVSGNMYSLITEEHVSDETYKFIKDVLFDYDLVIIDEATDIFRNILCDLNIRYIDVWLSPIRFYKDLMFSFGSNCDSIQKKLKRYRLNPEVLYSEVRKIKDYFNLFHPGFNPEPDSALLVTQLFEDKSVISHDRFLKITDFVDEISDMSENYATIYLLKHPQMSDVDFEFVRWGLSSIKNIKCIENINTYYLLSHPNIRACIGISSSVLRESVYFGKKSFYLHKPPFPDTYVDIYEDFFDLEFWKDILDIRSSVRGYFFVCPQYLRGKFNRYSYTFCRDSESYVIIKVLEVLLRNGIRKINVYGSGELFKLLEPEIIGAGIDIVKVYDSKAYNGSFLVGKYKVEPLLTETMNDYPIVIASEAFVDEIRDYIDKVFKVVNRSTYVIDVKRGLYMVGSKG